MVGPMLLLLLGICLGSLHPVYVHLFTRRSPGLHSLLPPGLTPAPISTIPPFPSLPEPDAPIPDIVHYVYIKDQAEDLHYAIYLAVRSAMIKLQPDRIKFHCVRQHPSGYWWDRLLEWEGAGGAGFAVEVVKAREVDWVGPGRTPVKHVRQTR